MPTTGYFVSLSVHESANANANLPVSLRTPSLDPLSLCRSSETSSDSAHCSVQPASFSLGQTGSRSLQDGNEDRWIFNKPQRSLYQVNALPRFIRANTPAPHKTWFESMNENFEIPPVPGFPALQAAGGPSERHLGLLEWQGRERSSKSRAPEILQSSRVCLGFQAGGNRPIVEFGGRYQRERERERER